MNIIEALDHPDLFKGMFDAPSWRPWRVFLKALQALPMGEAELAVYRHHTGRTAPPAKASRYAELVCGRRGGKSRILSLIAVYLSCVLDHSQFLVPGETPVIAVIAKDREQAKVIKDYISGFIRAIPALSDMIDDELAESIRLTNGVVVEVHTASIGAPRGRTFLAVLADEIAFWPAAGAAANQDVEVINAVRPGLSTIPYSLLLIASSPYAKRGLLYTNYARFFGKDDASPLVWQGTTPEMNSTQVDDPVAAEMYETDPDRASAEFGAQFRSDIVAFITTEAVEAVVPAGVHELPPGGGIHYAAFADASGGAGGDSFTLAIGHMESDGIAVLDCVREVRPPYSPDDVTQEYATVLRSYGLARVVGDYFGGVWPTERFAAYGISYEVSKKNKSAIYQEFLPQLNSRRVRLLDHSRLVHQLCNLERKTSRGGKDAIGPEPDTHDDVANAVCGALVQVIEDRRPTLIRKESLTIDGEVAVHVAPAMLFSYLWVAPDGICGWAIFSFSDIEPVPLVLCDFDKCPYTIDLLPAIAQRLDAHASATGRRPVHVLMHVQEQLLEPAADALCSTFGARMASELQRMGRMSRMIEAYVIDARALEDPVRLLLAASKNAGAGRVKLGQAALERSGSRPLPGALAVKPGEVITSDPLRVCVLLGVAELDAAPSRRSDRDAGLRFG